MALLAGQLPVYPAIAQDPTASTELEELIPDSAVENPEEWAEDAVQATGAEFEMSLEPDSPMADMPEMTVDWPDNIELPNIDPVGLDEQIEFAAPDLPDTAIPTGGITEKINSQLVLAFPDEEALFPIRKQFVERFEALSNIEELSDREDNIAQLGARARADEELLIEVLRAYGHYDGQVIRTVSRLQPNNSDADDRAQVRFDVIPGPRYTFGEIDLGNLSTATDAESLRASFEIVTGDPMSNDKIVEERSDLGVALGESGYPFAVVEEAELLVDHREQRGGLTMPVEPNGKYAFGPVVSALPDFLSGEHLASIARFDSGETYKRSLEFDLRRAIIATGLVSSVTVTPREIEPPIGEEPGVVALDVNMTKAPLRTIAGAVGYGSEEGIRVAASWEHRNLFPPEGALKIRGILGTQEQLVGATFTKSNFGGRDRIFSLDAYASTLDSDAFDARTAAVVGTYERTSTLLFQKPLSWSFGFEAVATSERSQAINGVVQPRRTFFVGALPISALIDTSDDLLDPKKGFRLGARISPEISRADGVQSFYLRSQVDASYYQLIGDKTVIAARARVASIPGTDRDNIAPSRRLYAGGGSSVRGYGYQQIGPRDLAGNPVGGRSAVEFSLEARVQTGLMDGAVSVVPFIDAGSVGAGQTPDFDEIKFGAGVGVRYDTGFGPIRIDVGVPLNPGPNDNPVAVYVSLGQAF